METFSLKKSFEDEFYQFLYLYLHCRFDTKNMTEHAYPKCSETIIK